MAKSFDSGKTWQKIAGNPILPSEPEDLEVTGWRDPFVSSWPSMAAALGRDSEETLFGIISGGIRDVTPTTFLYAIDANDLTKWQYVGPLVNFGLNLRPSRWSGDLGKNWEVTNFATLEDEKDPNITRDFLVMGTEGCLPSALSQNDDDSPTSGPERPLRGQLWMSGFLKTNTSPKPTSTASSAVQMQYGPRMSLCRKLILRHQDFQTHRLGLDHRRRSMRRSATRARLEWSVVSATRNPPSDSRECRSCLEVRPERYHICRV
jgi:beta-fructofuranosidase